MPPNKRISRKNRASAHALGLSAKSYASSASQWPRHHKHHKHHKHLPSSNELLKTTWHIKPTQRLLLHKITFFFYNKQERVCIESSPGGTVGILQGQRPMSIIVYIPLHLHLGGRSIQVLWPICKAATVHSQTRCPSFFSLKKSNPERSQQGITTHTSGLLIRRRSGSESQCAPEVLSTWLLPACQNHPDT